MCIKFPPINVSLSTSPCVKIKWRPRERDIRFKKVYNSGNFSIEMIRSVFGDLFLQDPTRTIKITMYEDKVGGERDLPEEEKGT